MLSRSLCRSWGLHWLSGVKLRVYDGSFRAYDGSSPLQRAMRILLLRALSHYRRVRGAVQQSARFAPPRVLLLRGNLRWLTATQELFVSRRYLVTGHSSLCLACSSSRSAALGA